MDFVQDMINLLYVNKETYARLIARDGKRAADNALIANVIEQEMNGAGDDYPLVALPKMLCKRIITALRNDKGCKPVYKDEFHVYCGSCNKRIPLKIKANYCHKCGEKIDWSR